MVSRHIVAAIACHNRRETTLACLAALERLNLPEACRLSVVLVDDGSSDGTAAAVKARHPDTVIIPADGSLYWAGAMILAERRALELGADFVLWLNDDVVLEATALLALVQTSDAGGMAIAVACLADPDTGAASYGGQRAASLWHKLRLRLISANGTPQPCDTFQGNCVLVPAEICRRMQGIDPVFLGVQGMADTDYGFRATRLGIPLLATPEVVGYCRLNRALPPWRQPKLRRLERLRSIVGPRGMPPKSWARFAARHGGLLWPLIWLLPQLKAVYAALTVPFRPAGPLAVSLVEGIATIYRLPFYRGLAARQDIAFHIYDGTARPGRTADQAALPLPLPASRGFNLYWPDHSGRIAWSSGAIATLRRGFDAVVVGQHIHDLSLWVVWLWRILFGWPRLLAMGHFRVDGSGLLPWARRLYLKRIDGALCYTEAGRDACLRHSLPADRVTVIGNTLDTARLLALAAARHERREELRRQLGVAENEAIFLLVGRLYAERRCDMAVTAIQELIRRGFACRLVVIGDGPLRDQVTGQPGVTWLGRIYDETVLADWFAVAFAMVMPDAIGLSAVHAMAHEVPVISLANGRAHGPEFGYLEQGRTALLATDATSLADHMQTLIETPALRHEMAGACRQTAERLSISGMVEQACAGILRAAGATQK